MNSSKLISKFYSCAAFVAAVPVFLALASASCSAQPAMSEDAALRSLREMTKSGALPGEPLVADIENRFAGKQTGALARLLRARIKFQNGDNPGAAQLLDSEMFGRLTGVADYAAWLRLSALIAAGNQDEATKAYSRFVVDFKDSMRLKDTKIMWAENLLKQGKPGDVPAVLDDLNRQNAGDALLVTARSYEMRGQRDAFIETLRKAYFYSAGSESSQAAETKLKALSESLEPKTKEEILARANKLFDKNQFQDAAAAYDKYVTAFPHDEPTSLSLKRVKAYARSGQMAGAELVFGRMSNSAPERQECLFEIAVGNAKSRNWNAVQTTVNRMKTEFPASPWTPKAMVRVGEIAGEQRKYSEKDYYLKSTLTLYPNATEIAEAQFELAWNQHELKDFEKSSTMLTEHLARYVDKDTSYRGQSGYWAARDSEKAGKIDEACALYDGTIYRYGSNWYGYQALQRLMTLRRQGKCQTTPRFPADSLVPQAVENLRGVTVAAETATEKELKRAEKSEQLSTIGLFDWAIEELEAAKKTANNSPSINLALARYYRLKGDNVAALRALMPSYPDYSQMFPEEMGREEWDIFYPLSHWNEIKFWAGKRNLDPYIVAGLIRQETIFNPKARSGANAYGMMQLLIPTAKSMARKYGSARQDINAGSLFDASLNIELGTAYMREQLTKYGSIEHMSVAYNAGPGRVVSWRKTLPLDMDEFVEEIPFSETRGYVKGVIRNSAQYRRLYDESGRFKSNVGANPLRGSIDKLPAKTLAEKYPDLSVDRSRTAK